LIVAAPATISLVQEGYADVPGALFIALAALCAWLYLEEPRFRWTALLAVFATAGASTKREAWTFALGLFVVALVGARYRKRPLLPVLGGFALFAATIGAWLAWLAHHGANATHGEEDLSRTLHPLYLADHIGRAAKAVGSLAGYSGRPSLWLIAAPLTLVAVAAALWTDGGRSVVWFLVPLVGLEYAALVWAFWISNAPIDWHLNHAAPRVVSTPIFVLVTFLPLLLTPSARLGKARGDRLGL